MSAKKVIVTVAVALCTIAACFLIYEIVFNNGGVLQKGWNAVATTVNEQFDKMGNGDVLPMWEGVSHIGNQGSTGGSGGAGGLD